jgi:capsid protein
MADILEMEGGLESLANLLNSRGYDHDGMMTEIARDRDFRAKLKLAFKGDPMTPGQTEDGGGNAGAENDPTRMVMLALARRLMASR